MIEINLLPTTQYIWLRSRILMSILASVGCALLCLWTVHGWFIRAIHREQVYQASLFQALEEKRMQRKLISMQGLRVSQNSVLSAEHLLQRKIFSAIFQQLASAQNDQACLTQIEWNKESVHFIGYTSSLAAMSTIMKHYQVANIPPLRLIDFHYHSRSGNKHFHLQGTLKDDSRKLH